MFDDLSIGATLFLLLALGLALSFEFVNGFHDTANAVATVIYTNSLRPTVAVMWSGLWNLLGVLTSSGAVAFGILALLPVELILNVGSAAGFAMIFSLLLSAIIWNLGTWYFGLPASSSHTMIGAIMGVGLANAVLKGGSHFGEGVNWHKAEEVGISLLVSPLVGFGAAALLLLLLKAVVRVPALYREPDPNAPPPLWIRAILVLTCTGVSFAHGSNDGQKGMGLILLILIGILPAQFALNPTTNAAAIQSTVASLESFQAAIPLAHGDEFISRPTAIQELSGFLKTSGTMTERTMPALGSMARSITTALTGKASLKDVKRDDRSSMRTDIYLVSETLAKLRQLDKFRTQTELALATELESKLEALTRYIPPWVKIAIALALGLGTMIGWQRIVVTVGEKIGKTHLSYAQGAAAELVAAITIGGADAIGLPVSTTHVLSSGVAGTMAANRSGLQTRTLRNLLLAWILTLPVCVFLGALLFALGFDLVARMGLT
jgi:inorganic phosphate transporter, PiT family